MVNHTRVNAWVFWRKVCPITVREWCYPHGRIPLFQTCGHTKQMWATLLYQWPKRYRGQDFRLEFYNAQRLLLESLIVVWGSLTSSCLCIQVGKWGLQEKETDSHNELWKHRLVLSHPKHSLTPWESQDEFKLLQESLLLLCYHFKHIKACL